ncbi:MAG TPA: GNAT family N-acetyltransferase [Thermoplasmata archaeon]|nr:GNAT family N-acetyltransferase [Thermoplasmata archaeon]
MAEERARAGAAALESERQFVLALGGFALQIPGAVLVTHEKLPVPRFNYVQVEAISPERQTAFFERALDHYFQRALRPTFRLPRPVPAHLDAGLRRFGFRSREEPLEVLVDDGEGPAVLSRGAREIREAEPSELDRISAFWTEARERPEFRSALDVAWHHPNPDEELRPLLALEAGAPVAAALFYRYRATASLQAVATQPDARGRGAASALVRVARSRAVAEPGGRASITADSARQRLGLERLGFRSALSFRVYELGAEARLEIPSPGPPGPPRWRPPRTSRRAGGSRASSAPRARRSSGSS